MPNHFQGGFVAKGDSENITFLKDELEEHLNDYASNVFPVPEGYVIKDKIKAALKGCKVAEQSDYWGSKWGIYDFEDRICKTTPNTLCFEFSSAWSMPDKLFKMMAKKYNLYIRACGYDTGCGFMTFLDTNEDRVENYTLPDMMICDLKKLVEEYHIVLDEDHREFYEKNKNWSSSKDTRNFIINKDEIKDDETGELSRMLHGCPYDDEEDELRDIMWHYFDDFWNCLLQERGWHEYFTNHYNKDKSRE